MSGEILFLAHRLPFPPDRGDRIRAYHVLRALAALAPVHVGCLDEGGAGHIAAGEAALASLAQSCCVARRRRPLALAGLSALARHEPVSVTAFRNAHLSTYITRLLASGRIAAIYAFSGQMGQYFPEAWDGRRVIDFVDVDSAKFAAYAVERRGLAHWVAAREARLLRREEMRCARRADVSLLVSEDEAALFAAHFAEGDPVRGRIRSLANGVDSAVFDPAQVAPAPALTSLPGPRLVFVGQMDYPPNILAATRAATRILPLVQQHLPAASLHIVGRAPTPAVQGLVRHSGVRVWGAVDDVRPFLAAAACVVVPLDIARGVQNKVLEAMAMARAVVLTPAAATGIAADDRAHGWLASSDAEFAAAIIALSQDRAQAEAMGQAARARMLTHHSWGATLAPLGALIGIDRPATPEIHRDAA